jgi:uncharacterized protein GlcG (DUF336 family)
MCCFPLAGPCGRRRARGRPVWNLSGLCSRKEVSILYSGAGQRSPWQDETEGNGVKQKWKLERAEARAMVDAALAKAAELNVPQTVCITDDGGFPLIIERMDGARITGPQIAWNKAFTAAGHKRSTHLFNTPPNGPALHGNEAYGIEHSFDGKFAIFVGGFPIVVDGDVIGGLGMSGGNGEQDTACGLAGLEALRERLAAEGLAVTVAADIKR